MTIRCYVELGYVMTIKNITLENDFMCIEGYAFGVREFFRYNTSTREIDLGHKPQCFTTASL
jgi:hypothetical protein